MEIPSQWLNKMRACACGKTHFVPIDAIVVEDGANAALAAYLKEQSARSVLVVADRNTITVGAEVVVAQLRAADVGATLCVLEAAHELHPDEAAIAQAQTALAQCGADFLVAVGSGVINDVTRFVSFAAGLPYVVMATAPSMDGYASAVAAMQFAGVKTTSSAHTPRAIFADDRVLAEAPWPLIQAGFGDLLGKVTSLLDWKLAHHLYDEYFCDVAYGMVAEPLQYCLHNAASLRNRDVTAVRQLFIGLINAGIAMAMVGNSRPCSGSEHHCSHYWDLLAFQGKRSDTSHGLQVGYAVRWTIRFYQEVARLRSIQPLQLLAPDAEFEDYARDFYGAGADEVISAQRDKAQWLADNAEAAKAHLGEGGGATDVGGAAGAKPQLALAHLLRALEPEISLGDTAHGALRTMGIPAEPGFLGVDEETLTQTFLHARELRARYTVFDFLAQQGLLADAAARVMDGA